MCRIRKNGKKNQKKVQKKVQKKQKVKSWPVEAILKKRINKDKTEEYLIKWENFGDKYNLWISKEGLFCDTLLEEFEARLEKDSSLIEDLSNQLPRSNSESRIHLRKRNIERNRIDNEDSDTEIENDYKRTFDKFVGAFSRQNEINFLVKWKESRKATTKSLDFLRKNYPDQLITYLVSKIKFVEK